MDQNSAQNLIKETFNFPFKEENFLKFSNNLLDKINQPKNINWLDSKFLPSGIKEQIVEYKINGNLEYKNGDKIVVVMAKLKSSKIVERSRSVQREFAKWIMDANEADACLVSFFADNYDDWRFSLVSIDYNRELSKSGKIKVRQTISPLKRYSYLVGKNEPNNTAKLQLAPLLYNNEEVTIALLENAFSVEKVTKEFFQQYKRLCFKIADELKLLRKQDKNIDNNLKKHFLKEIDFAKKLMGQIVFLYFIQKKGWIGIIRDKTGFFTKWGSGPRNFMRKLFNKEYCDYDNFFNDVLEDLFYIGLSVDLPDNYYSKIKCKVPFLNGGLFEPINDYNWKETDITIKNSTIKEILDVFDSFNFTIMEEDPLEKEVAIDPETLGKVFENLLDENLQRGHGVFYTPRNIVNYMCEVAIASFLKNKLNEDLTYFKYKKYINEITLQDFEKKDSLNKLSNETYLFFKRNSEKIDNFLKNIRICDPAVGSGAFPVSMMNIVVKIRKVAKLYKNDLNENINYKLKYQYIKKNIYGVDIDKSATEIAKLRLWLSLTIDEDNYEKINPLPNLDYKILQGNSLFDDLGGSLSTNETKQQFTFDSSSSEKEDLIESYFNKIKEYDLLTNQREKKAEREKINNILKKTILAEIQQIKSFDSNNPLLKQLEKNISDLDKKINDFFCWNIIFNKIFKNNGGFDIIITNPPYLRQEEFVHQKERLNKKYKLFNSTSDLYTYFYELSYNLLNENGTSVLITSNKWLRAKYGKILRNFFKKDVYINEILNFGDLKIFDNAVTNTNITSFVKKISTNEKIPYIEFSKNNKNENLTNYSEKNYIECFKKELDTENFYFLDKENENLRKKIINKGKPLGELNYEIFRGVTTGYNNAFVIDEKIKKELIKNDPNSKIIIKRLIRGRDIKKYKFKESKSWIIFTRRGVNISKFKEIEKYLLQFKKLLKPKKNSSDEFGRKPGNYKWYEIQDETAYYEKFKQKKIIWIELSNSNRFCVCDTEHYLLAGSNMLLGTDLDFLNSFLNSKIALFLFNLIGSSSGMSTSLWKQFALEKLYIPHDFPIDKKNEIKLLTKKIENNSNLKNIDILINKIDHIYYQFYNLDNNEISLIENKI